MFDFVKSLFRLKKEAFKVRRLDRYHIEYSEGPKTVLINYERLADGYGTISVSVDSIKNWKDSSEPITATERELIIERVFKALRKKGLRVSAFHYNPRL